MLTSGPSGSFLLFTTTKKGLIMYEIEQYYWKQPGDIELRLQNDQHEHKRHKDELVQNYLHTYDTVNIR